MLNAAARDLALRRQPPPLWLSVVIAAAVVALLGYLRLVLFQDRLIPLAYSLPLLIALWDRRLKLMHLMAGYFSVMATIKTFWILPRELYAPAYDWTIWSMQMANIWVVAGVVHALVRSEARIERVNDSLEQSNAELEAANEELAASNEELASREEEIARQNEELQSQTEEMEQQAQEMEQQTEAVTELNQELVRREKGMQTLLDSARWMRSELDEEAVLTAICEAAIQAMGEAAAACAVMEESKGMLRMRATCGFHAKENGQPIAFSRSFAALVMERGQTAYLEDVRQRPDVTLPSPEAGGPLLSVLATPVWRNGEPAAALQVYSAQPRHWTVEQFRVLEWLSAQCSLALAAMSYQRELEIRRRDAEEASVQKTRFLAAVSHDVRTPTNAICLLADLIEQTAASPERAMEIVPMARDLKSSARALVELVSDVLDLARFDTGKLDVQVADFSLEALVQAEVRQAAPIAQSRGLRLRASAPDGDLWVRSDRMKLARVLSNLIGNALKFTEDGEVEVRSDRAPDGSVELRVSDTGVGIAAEDLPRIFDEFHQLRNPERDRSKGTGLGLAICKRLVEGLGCAMSVSSTPGEGTAFVVRLPADVVVDRGARPEPQGDAQPRPGDPRRLDEIRILLVEDHDVTRRTVAELLAGEGAVVSQARSGREALHLLHHGPHDVILLDLMLPDMDGSEVLRHVHAHRPAGLRCVLAVSGDARQTRADEVRRLGADDLVTKPVNIDRLIDVIRGQCRREAPLQPRARVDSADQA